LEDKIVQGATAMVLNAIYEEDFLGFSYGFRPGRDHTTRWMPRRRDQQPEGELHSDADIRSFFDTVDQQWLVRF
jgi:retron-type reverse transcriptase